jgi:uncharacterized protein
VQLLQLLELIFTALTTQAMLHFFFRILKSAAFVICMSYISICTMMWYKQRDFVFGNLDRSIAFESLNFQNTEAVWLKTPDGAQLEAFYHAAPMGRPTVLYFHGKDTEISNESEFLKAFQAADFGFLGISYRGYGKSSGKPTETGLITDAVTAYDWLRKKGIDAEKIMLAGMSMGSGVAVQLAAQKPVGAIALGAPYSSVVEIAEEKHWYLPVRLLMKDQFWSSSFIGEVNAPVLILHGTEDQVIPVRYGQKLFALANEPKSLKLVEDQGHLVIFQENSLLEYTKFFNSVFSKTQPVQ